MTANKDWLAYVLEPHTLLTDLGHLTDDYKVSLMRSFLAQAECHDRRLSSVSVGEEEKLNSENPSPSLNAIPINYDKSRTLDCLAVVIAAHFRFNVNLFAGMITELPLRLASRLYRMLFHTLLERNSRGSTESGGACTTPYDLGPWDSLEPTLAFATLVYHLWCLQVALSDSMLSLPNRDMTPAVWGLSEVPDQAFLQDSRADREALLMRHEESALRVHDLLRRLQANESAVSVARPTPASLAITRTVSGGEVPLSANRLVAGTSFTLGRLAFQHNLLERATELFILAQKAIAAAKLEYIEEAGMTSLLVKSYLTCCQQQQLPRLLPTPSPITGHWHLVDVFCTTLRQSLDANDPELFSLLAFSIPSPVRANLRGSSSSSSSSMGEVEKGTAKGKFLQEDLIAALEVDISMSRSTVLQLGFGLRRYLQQLIHEALVTLTARCANSPRKEITHLRRVFHDWRSFYTKVVVSNGMKGILQSSSVQSAAFCETLLSVTGVDDAPSIDAKEAAGILFTGLDRLLCGDSTGKTEVINFIGDFLVRIRLMLSGGRSTAASRTAMVFVDALAGSALMNSLPTDFQTITEALQKDRRLDKQAPDYLFNDLPDVAAGCTLPPPLVVPQVHRGHLYPETRTTSPFSLLITSSNPKIVLNACTDLLNTGLSVEVILRSGGWVDTILPSVIKWITPSDLPSKQRRDASSTGGLPPRHLYEFLAVALENGQCCLPPLLLLLRAIDFRRERGDYEAATAFCVAANHVLPPLGQGAPGGPTGGGGGGGALWRRSLPRWIRGIMEHEAVVVDLLKSMNCNSFSFTSSQLRVEEAELVSRCKAILANDLGPDAVISDDLVSCAACYLLIKEPAFLSTLGSGPPMLEFITCLHKLSMEKEKSPLAVRDLCINRLSIWLRPILEVPSPLPPPPPPSRMSRDPRHLATVTGAGGSGSPALTSNTPIPPPNTDPLRFLVRLLTQVQGDGVHRRLLDCFITCLAGCFMSIQPLFKTDTIAEIWLSLPPLSGVAPQALAETLQFALTCGISAEPRNVKWLLLQADLQMASTNADSRAVLSLILQAAAVASDYFARPVPSSVFTERTLAAMVQCCRSLGCIGESIVLCQFGSDRRALVTTGLQIIESLRCEGNLALPYTFDSLDGIAAFLWNLDLLEALANLQFSNCSQSKRTTFLRCITQPEVNASNTREILQMTRNKRATEFLRHLSSQMLM
ncbi:Integrator complex subunit 8 [Echinococcus granulosus]|nr:Integrator complex subunit 8 [Echinococcus granulosus]